MVTSFDQRQFLYDNCRPFFGHIVIFFILSFITSILDGISIGLLVPLMGSIQQVDSYSNLSSVLQFLVIPFADLSTENKLISVTCALVIIIWLKNIFLAVTHSLGYWVGLKIEGNTRTNIFTKMLHTSLNYYHQNQIGKIAAKAMQNTTLLKHLIRDFFDFFVNIAILFALFFLLLFISWKITLLTILFISFIVVIVLQYSKWLKKQGEIAIQSHQDLVGSLIEMIYGINVIKSFCKEKSFQTTLEKKIQLHQQASYKTSLATLFHILVELLGVFVIGILFIVAMKSVDDLSLLLVQFVPFFYILIRMVSHIKILNEKWNNMTIHRSAIEETVTSLNEITHASILDGNIIFGKLEKAIEFKSVTFCYNSEPLETIKNVSFSIPRGKITAIVGKSGCGKSTIVNLLMRFYEIDSGAVYVDDVPLQKLNLKSYRTKIGLVSQDTFIFNDTIMNNIGFAMGKDCSAELILDAAQKSSAHEFIQSLPNGYDTIVGDRGAKLSGGQRQRIAIARAIITDPDILIFDEATSALDNHTEKIIHRTLLELRKNRTVIIITHRLTTIKDADQVIVVNRGKIDEIGGQEVLAKYSNEDFE